MARFGFEDYDNYGNNNTNSFFTLKEDRDTAQVRFMYNDMEDVNAFAVHKVKIGDKFRHVNCLRTYNDPKSKCPFCREDMPQLVRLYVPVYNMDTQSVQTWERGKQFFNDLQSLFRRYANTDKPLVSNVFEIERSGRKGDKNTRYNIFPISADNTKMNELPDVTDPLGTIILDKTADEMEYFLDYGEFAERDNNIRREPERRDTRSFDQDRPTGRRTSMRSGYGEDDF